MSTNTTPKITGETVELRSGHLDDQQLARAEALDRAREVLTAKGFVSSSAADAMDLVHVAGWIIDGRDLWADLVAVGEDSTPTFVGTIRDAAETTARDFADFLGIDPDAPLPDSDGDAHDDDTQFGSVTA